MNYALIKSQEDVVDSGDVATGDIAIAILVAVDYCAGIIKEQVVVKRCHITAGNIAIAVHIAGYTTIASDNNIIRNIIVATIDAVAIVIPCDISILGVSDGAVFKCYAFANSFNKTINFSLYIVECKCAQYTISIISNAFGCFQVNVLYRQLSRSDKYVYPGT